MLAAPAPRARLPPRPAPVGAARPAADTPARRRSARAPRRRSNPVQRALTQRTHRADALVRPLKE
eukprot:1700811-Alexandrium_andersonii.AAC.1